MCSLVSKWFYDIFLAPLLEQPRRGPLIGETKHLDAQGLNYEGTRQLTRGFT
jgi:hypothetical protein